MRYPNHVNLGEILCGYPNLADNTAMYAHTPEFIRSLLQDGSFLAVRKLRQDVDELEQALSVAQADAAAAGLALTREEFMAKMMGRWPSGHPKAGQPLAVVPNPGPESNDFHFEADKEGALCPFHAHIRRANPRVRNPEAGSRPPRFMRRGMSYGPPRQSASNGGYASESPAQERGLIFMAYNASLGEQFELVQSWLTGGNSSGSFSGDSDPIFGIAEPGRRRYFRFEQTAKRSVWGSTDRTACTRSLVRSCAWSGARICSRLPRRRSRACRQRAAAQTSKRAVSWSADDGEKEIARLREIEAHATREAKSWRPGKPRSKIPSRPAISPPHRYGRPFASVTAAYCERRSAYWWRSRSLVDQVLQDPAGNLSVTGYLPRMQRLVWRNLSRSG